MTAKQERILHTATQLFGAEGVAAVSTARIAREAGVSEGLIFRHFGSKQGLVEAIVAAGQSSQQSRLAKVAAEENPTVRILALIDYAFVKQKVHGPQEAMLRQVGATEANAATSKLGILTAAFKDLNYEDPASEAAFLHYALRGITTAVAQGQVRHPKKLKEFVRSLYA